MTRQIYENKETERAEALIAKAFADHMKLDHTRKLSMAYGIDFAVVTYPGKWQPIDCYVEAKKRDLTFGANGGYFISLLKVMKARLITATCKTPCYLAVRFDDDRIRYANFADVFGHPCIEFGREDRDDSYDVEPCMIFGWHLFKGIAS